MAVVSLSGYHNRLLGIRCGQIHDRHATHCCKRKSELQRLKVIEIDFYSATSTLQDKIAGLEEELDELQDKLDGSDEYWDAYDELGGTDIEEQFWNDEISFEEYTRLIDQINKELDDKFGITALKESLNEAKQHWKISQRKWV